LRRVARADLDQLLAKALSLSNGFQVRELVKEYLTQQGLATILN
jgi:phosphotransferase system enzyme I (PtsP)